jgi:hypothetical protein
MDSHKLLEKSDAKKRNRLFHNYNRSDDERLPIK